MKKATILAAQPGWYSVTLREDQLQEYPVIAWMFEHREHRGDEEFRQFLSDVGVATPITLSGVLSHLCWEAVKAPDGTYWLQGSRLSREGALDTLRMLQGHLDEIRERELGLGAEASSSPDARVVPLRSRPL